MKHATLFRFSKRVLLLVYVRLAAASKNKSGTKGRSADREVECGSETNERKTERMDGDVTGMAGRKPGSRYL